MKTASIIIPTFNRANLVSRAIDSALSQSYPCEVIVCDHGSSDNTPEVVSVYGNKIKYIRREIDNGPIVCWRDGLENSSGDIIHFNYDDDWISPYFMEKTIQLLKDNVAFVYSRYYTHYIDNSVTIGNVHPANINPIKDIVHYLLVNPLTISPGCAIFRREDALKNLLMEIPGANGKYGKNSGVGEDLLLFLLTSLNYPKYAHISEPLANFADHPGSITADSAISGKRKELISAYQNAKNYYLSLPGSINNLSSQLGRTFFKIKWKLKSII